MTVVDPCTAEAAQYEKQYLDSIKNGDTRRRINAVRQLQDELDTIRASARRLRKVFDILEDDEGMVAAQHVGSYASLAEDRQRFQLHAHKVRLNAEIAASRKPTPDFPVDRDGNPLAWPDPNQPEWYVDAWNGVYDSCETALAEVPDWVAKEEDRTLAYGEPMKSGEQDSPLAEERPKIIVGITENGLSGVHAEGFDLPVGLRVIERDFTRGNEPGENGDLYVDTEL